MSFAVVHLYQFPISDPFSAGHVMTETEANVLNWHRARLIQKIVHRWVTEVIDDNGGEDSILSAESVAALRDRISEFDRNYNLQPAKEPRASILEYHLDVLARNFLYQNGYTDLREEDVERIKKTPDIQKRARELIKSSTFTLEELFV